MEAKRTPYFTIRLSDELREQLFKLAKSNYRSAAKEAEMAIEAHLRRSTGEPSPGFSKKVA